MNRSAIIRLAGFAVASALLASPVLAKTTLNFWILGNEEASYQKLIAEFERLNPDIGVKLQLFPSSQYTNAVNLAFRSGNQPDVFRNGALVLPVASQVDQGWLLPLDRFVTAGFLARFPSNSVIEGVARFGGKIYSPPLVLPGTSGTPFLYYNKKLFADAGLTRPPKTWDELRSYAKRLTEAGKGRYFGYGMVGKAVNATYAASLGALAGFVGHVETSLNYRTGRADAANPAIIRAIELLRKMNLEDKSLIPGWEALDTASAPEVFAQGRMAMFVTNAAAAGSIRQKGFTEADFGIAPVPTPTGRYVTKIPLLPGTGWYAISAKTKYPNESWKFLNFLYSAQGTVMALEQGIAPSVPAIKLPADTIRKASFTASQLLTILQQQGVAAPDPLLRSTQWQAVLANLKIPTSTLGQIQVAAVIGQVDYASEARKFNATYDAAMDAAIAAARQEGAKVCRELLVFPTFNNTKSFTARDYQSLPGCP